MTVPLTGSLKQLTSGVSTSFTCDIHGHCQTVIVVGWGYTWRECARCFNETKKDLIPVEERVRKLHGKPSC